MKLVFKGTVIHVYLHVVNVHLSMIRVVVVVIVRMDIFMIMVTVRGVNNFVNNVHHPLNVQNVYKGIILMMVQDNANNVKMEQQYVHFHQH